MTAIPLPRKYLLKHDLNVFFQIHRWKKENVEETALFEKNAFLDQTFQQNCLEMERVKKWASS